jgi:high-affinity K+ transport system ATPase subunit B
VQQLQEGHIGNQHRKARRVVAMVGDGINDAPVSGNDFSGMPVNWT